MKKLIMAATLLILCGTAFSQIYTPVDPTIFGIFQNRVKAKFALHPPEKDNLLTNTNDTTAQFFYNRADSSFWGWSEARGFFKLGSGGVGGDGIVYTLEDNYDLTKVILLGDGAPVDSVTLVKSAIYGQDPVIIKDTLPVAGTHSYLFGVRKSWFDSLYSDAGGASTLQQAFDGSVAASDNPIISTGLHNFSVADLSGGTRFDIIPNDGHIKLTTTSGKYILVADDDNKVVLHYDEDYNIQVENGGTTITGPIFNSADTSTAPVNVITIDPVTNEFKRAAYPDVSQSLQQVTDIGYVTTRPIVSTIQLAVTDVGSAQKTINIQNQTVGNSFGFTMNGYPGRDANGAIYWFDADASSTFLGVDASSLGTNNILLPNTSGRLIATVNGTAPDGAGNVVIATGGGADGNGIYSGDGTLSSDRTVNLNGKFLYLNDAANNSYIYYEPTTGWTIADGASTYFMVSQIPGVDIQMGGAIHLTSYASGTITGTPTYALGLSGDQLITYAVPSGADSSIFETNYGTDTLRSAMLISIASKENALTFGLGFNRSVNTVIVDTSNSSILSRQRAAATYLLKTDTTSMLAGYQSLLNSHTTSIATANTNIALKLNKTDTTSMLAGYQSAINTNTTAIAGKQDALSGTGYSKWAGSSVSYLTPTQVTADLNAFTSLLQGVVPASGGGTTNFLRADGTWAAAGGSSTDAVADGATKGIASFTAADFNSASGIISLDYTNGQKATASVPGFATSNQVLGTIGTSVDGQGSVISTGSKGFITIPYNCTITNWYVTADVSGSVQFDIKRSGTTIVGAGNKPLLSSAISGNAAVASWTSTSVTAGDILEWVVDSASTLTNVTVVLKVTK